MPRQAGRRWVLRRVETAARGFDKIEAVEAGAICSDISTGWDLSGESTGEHTATGKSRL